MEDTFRQIQCISQDIRLNPINTSEIKDFKLRQIEEFRQTLIEIQQDLEFATYCESQECGCDDPNECLECTKKQILQKISECGVENAVVSSYYDKSERKEINGNG